MNRRGFLGAMLAACAAPAIVRVDSLMRIVPVETQIILPDSYLAFVHPDVCEDLLKLTEMRMEIGRVEAFRFIMSDDLPVARSW